MIYREDNTIGGKTIRTDYMCDDNVVSTFYNKDGDTMDCILVFSSETYIDDELTSVVSVSNYMYLNREMRV